MRSMSDSMKAYNDASGCSTFTTFNVKVCLLSIVRRLGKDMTRRPVVNCVSC